MEKSYLKNRDDANHLITTQKPGVLLPSRARFSAFISTLDGRITPGYLGTSEDGKNDILPDNDRDRRLGLIVVR